MASLNGVNGLVKEMLALEIEIYGQRYKEVNNHLVFKIKDKDYTIPKPERASVEARIDFMYMNMNHIIPQIDKCIRKLKKHFNVTSSWVGELYAFEAHYAPDSDQCIIRLSASMLPTDDEKYFHRINFNKKMMDIVDGTEE